MSRIGQSLLMREFGSVAGATVTNSGVPRSVLQQRRWSPPLKNPIVRRCVALAAGLAATFALLSTSAAHAASLLQVNNWGATGVPSDITMYVYVPDKVVKNPPS